MKFSPGKLIVRYAICSVVLRQISSSFSSPVECSGFIYGISVADQFIKTGMYKNILVIGSENHSGGLDKTTRGRSVSVIFGDGAGAGTGDGPSTGSGASATCAPPSRPHF